MERLVGVAAKAAEAEMSATSWRIIGNSDDRCPLWNSSIVLWVDWEESSPAGQVGDLPHDGSKSWAFVAFNLWACSITCSRKWDKLSGFANELPCGIKYLTQKKPDKLCGFSLFNPSVGSIGRDKSLFFLSKTQKPTINVTVFIAILLQ